MAKPAGVLIFGANGSGKTSLGRELASCLGYKHMDIEDYHFLKSDLPYSRSRSKNDCQALLLADIKKHPAFILTAVTGDFGSAICSYFDLAIYLTAPLEIRLERIRQRALAKHASRVQPAGDMYAQQEEFLSFVAQRPLAKIKQWGESLACPVIHLDGTLDLKANVATLLESYFSEEPSSSKVESYNRSRRVF